ncbi:hypothetical protein J4217_02180 [Candidatus Pacearchaeota archaeon]|nr:hypothetical protein [Candidatus Pacearchaeota archaeon]
MINYKKIAAVLAGVTMLGSTVALAAAANYPAPFVSGGSADVAIVYGSTAANTDLVAVADINAQLQQKLAEQTATTSSSTSVSITGEAAPLFTSSTKIYVNDTLNQVKSALTKTELPTVLKDGSFSGNVDASYTQTITLGANPQVTYAKQPTSSNDPVFGLTLSTSTNTYIYNASVTFNKAVNLTHADSKGQDLTLFGQKYTIASSTSVTDLVLLKQAQKVDLSSDSPSTKVTIGGKEYTVELVSASDTAATIKVTDSTGSSDSKEVSENASKKVQGLTVAILTADETNLKLSATILAGAEKVTLVSGSSVTTGDDATTVDGTKAYFTKTTDLGDLTKITVSVAAPNSDSDAILEGGARVDPVFGTFKIDFSALTVPSNSTARENIAIKNDADDKLTVTLTNNRGQAKTVQWAKNYTGTDFPQLMVDNDGRNLSVREMERVHPNDYAVLGNEADGYLMKVYEVKNASSGYSSDKVRLQDVFSGDIYEATLTGEGAGTVTVGGKVFTIAYWGASDSASDAMNLTINYPDSASSTAAMVLYPTIQTSKGAKVAFYEPLNISLSSWDNSSNNGDVFSGTQGNDVTTIRLPDGDGYTDVAVLLSSDTAAANGAGNFSIGGTNVSADPESLAKSVTVGRLTYNFTWGGENLTSLYLVSPDGGNIAGPALIVFEEKDDNTNYEAVITTVEAGGNSDDGIGVNDVVRTWGGDAVWDRISLASNSKLTKEADLWGSIVTEDSTDSDQKQATISYPDEQVAALIYAAANAAEIEAATSGGSTGVKALGSVAVADSEVSAVSAKNLIVVGGNCVNSVAAALLGTSSTSCGADFETKTGVTGGSFLIQSFTSPYASTKIATLVAGRYAADTTKAAKYLTTQAVDTTAGKKYKGTSETVATVETVTA